MTGPEALARVQAKYPLRIGQIIHTVYTGGDIFYLDDARLVQDLKRQFKFAFEEDSDD